MDPIRKELEALVAGEILKRLEELEKKAHEHAKDAKK